jgi:hypothetical protein
VKVAALLACWIVAVAGVGTGGARVLAPGRSTSPHADFSPRSRASCLPRDSPSVAPAGDDLANGANLTVDKGQIVYVTLEEPAEIEPAPSSFPWPTPRSSNTRVLVGVPICKYPELITSEALTVTAFRHWQGYGHCHRAAVARVAEMAGQPPPAPTLLTPRALPVLPRERNHRPHLATDCRSQHSALRELRARGFLSVSPDIRVYTHGV